MKSLVIYDSNFGNTKIIASILAEQLQGEAHSVNDLSPDILKGIELLVVGSPINGWRPTPKINSFLSSLTPEQLCGIKAAAFDTRIKVFYSGNAAKKISESLQIKGATIVAEPKGFYVAGKEGPLAEGELENTKAWANQIIQNLKKV